MAVQGSTVLGSRLDMPRPPEMLVQRKSNLGQVITITSGKGGVGKTTTTANLGASLARLGCRVVCLDIDIGLRNLDLIMGLESQVVFNLIDILERDIAVEDALIRSAKLPNLFLIPAAQYGDKTILGAMPLVFLCVKLRNMFDYILIDSPAGIEEGFKSATAPADQILLVTTPDVAAVRDADRVVGLLQSVAAPSPQLLINRYRPELSRRKSMLEIGDVADILSLDILGVVPEDEAVIAAAHNCDLLILNKKSEAGREYLRIGERLVGQRVPGDSTRQPNGMFASLLGRFQ